MECVFTTLLRILEEERKWRSSYREEIRRKEGVLFLGLGNN